MISCPTCGGPKPNADWDWSKADATLFAAAPELLAALKGLLDAGHYDNDGDFVIPCTGVESDGDCPDYLEAPSLRAANLAIAKAEGRQGQCQPTVE